MIRYELHFGEAIVHGEAIKELKEFAKSITQYYEIYKIYCSSMVEHPVSKLNIMDMREIVRLKERGWTSSAIANKFSVPQSQIRKISSSLHI